MSTLRLLAGRGFNLLERGVVTMSPAASAIYPPSKLYDGSAEWPARFGSLAASSYVQIDLDQFLDTGNMDVWVGGLPLQPPTQPAGGVWTKTGTVVQDTTIKQAGVSSAKLSVGTLVYTRWARAGEQIKLEGYLRGDGTKETTFRIRNLQTGSYGTAAGGWQATPVDAATRTAASFGGVTIAWTIEGSSVCRTDLVQIEVTFVNAAGDGWVDSWRWIPYVDWCSIHGHAFDPTNALRLYANATPDFGAPATMATFAVKRRAFYAYLEPPVLFYRYWRVQISGSNSTATGPAWMGEIILGQSVSLATGLDFPIETELDRPQVRLVSGSGGESAAATSADLARRLTLRSTYAGRTAWDEMMEAILEATQNGLYPLVLAPEVGGGADGDADLVVFGRLGNPVPLRRTQYLSRSVSLSLREFPFPMVL